MYNRFKEYDTHAQQIAKIRANYTEEQKRKASIMYALKDGWHEYQYFKGKTDAPGLIVALQNEFSYDITHILKRYEKSIMERGFYGVLIELTNKIYNENFKKQ